MKDNSPDTEPVFMRDPATQREEASRDTQPEHLCCICDSPVVSLFPDGNYYCSIDKPSWQELEIGIAAPGPSLPEEAKPGEGRIRDLAVEIVDSLFGYTMEYAPSPAQHRVKYYLVEEKLTELAKAARESVRMGK